MSYHVPNNPRGNSRIRKIILVVYLCLCIISIPLVFFSYQTSKIIDDFYVGANSNAGGIGWQIFSLCGLICLALAAFFWVGSIKRKWPESKRKYNLILFLQLVSLSCLTLSIWNLLYLMVFF